MAVDIAKGIYSSSYNPRKTTDEIQKYKDAWAAADNDKDRNSAASGAAKYYDELRRNGYGAMADKLQASDNKEAKSYLDRYYAMSGKTAIRPYFQQKAREYKLDPNLVNSQLAYDNKTGTVSFAGRNLGIPDAEVDGTSYWGREDLDSIFDDYARSVGAVNPKDDFVHSQLKNYGAKIDEAWDMNKDSRSYLGKLATTLNPMDTAFGKAIMDRYEALGNQYGYNAAAAAAASNGGNIDSFAAANAMRQQKALESEGIGNLTGLYNDMFTNSYNAAQGSIENARGILSDLGGRIDNTAEESRLEKLNDANVAYRNAETSELTANGENDRWINKANAESDILGEVPNMVLFDNLGIIQDGRFVTDHDYSELLGLQQSQTQKHRDMLKAEQAKAEPDASEIDRLERLIRNDERTENAYRAARMWKTGLPEYSQYAESNYTGLGEAQPNAEMQMFYDQLKNSLDLANAEHESAENIANANNAAAIDQINAQTQGSIALENAKSANTINENNAATNNTIRANAAAYNLASLGGGSNVDSEGRLTELTGGALDEAVRYLNDVRMGKEPDWSGITWKDDNGKKYSTGMIDNVNGVYKVDKGKTTATAVMSNLIYKYGESINDAAITKFMLDIGFTEDEIAAAATTTSLRNGEIERNRNKSNQNGN